MEIYRGGVIPYDTGDFVDDYHVDPLLRNDRSFLFLVTVTNDGVTQVELVPALISQFQVNKAEGEEREKAIARMRELSAEFGTKFDVSGEGWISISLETR